MSSRPSGSVSQLRFIKYEHRISMLNAKCDSNGARWRNLRLFVSTLLMMMLIAMNAEPLTAQPDDVIYDETRVPEYSLPNVLLDNRGRPIHSVRQWQDSQRPRIVELFESHVYGRIPDRPAAPLRFELLESSPGALGGMATRKQVRIFFSNESRPRMDLLLYVPNNANGPAPGFLGLNFFGNQSVHEDPQIRMNENWMRRNDALGIENHRATDKTRGAYAERWQVEMVVKAGFALATIYYGDIDPDKNDFTDGVHPLFYRPGQTAPEDDECGSIGAWAWGLSRALDYLEQDPAIDARRVAVIGHSRLGKTALWAAAGDQRFAMAISNNSGCGGAALYRRCFGERIHHMVKPIGYWFCKNHHQYALRENELPVDQHMLFALIAPRPVYVASATEDLWADPKGEFLAAQYAGPVYQLFGLSGIGVNEMPPPNRQVGDTIGYHLRQGRHDVTRFDWEQYLQFAARHFDAI